MTEHIPPTLRWLDLAHVAAMIGVSKRTAERIVLSKDFPLPSRPGGGHKRWKATEVDEWMGYQRDVA